MKAQRDVFDGGNIIFFKKSALALLRKMVTLIVSSFKTSSSGEGKKSSANLTLPTGSF